MAMTGRSGSPLAGRPLLRDYDDELSVVGNHNLLFLGADAQIPQLILRVQVSNYPASLRRQANHASRILFRVLLGHRGKTPKHLTLLVANDIVLNARLHLDAFNRLLNLALSGGRVWWGGLCCEWRSEGGRAGQY